ncbi:unnamed protein product [Symbiodinium sp. CCMP2456]|nr:unnamed protein product [Symbiodinium sp. CCMP2456]
MALDRTSEILSARGVCMPHHLVVQTDNTAREQRNQHTVLAFADLVCRGIFESVTQNYFQVGHSHNECDQRFVAVASCLSSCRTLQTPEEFARCIREKCRASRNRHMEVEVVDGWHDWQSRMKAAKASVSGLAIQSKGQDVCHSFRFLRRSALKNIPGFTADACHGLASPKDCFLLCKRSMHDVQVAQDPLLLLSAAQSRDLSSDLQTLPRAQLGERALKEFQKTASRVEASVLDFVFQDGRVDQLMTVSPDLIAELANFRPGLPRPVAVRFGPRSMPPLPRPLVRGTLSESEEEDMIGALGPRARAGKATGSRPAKRARPAAVEPAPEAWQASLVETMEHAKLAGEDRAHLQAKSPPDPEPPLPADMDWESGLAQTIFGPTWAADLTPPRRKTLVEGGGVEHSPRKLSPPKSNPPLPRPPKFLEDDEDSLPGNFVAVKQEEPEVPLPAAAAIVEPDVAVKPEEPEVPLPAAAAIVEPDVAVKQEEPEVPLPAAAAISEQDVAIPLPSIFLDDDNDVVGEMSAPEKFDASLPELPDPGSASVAKAMAVVNSSPRNLKHSKAHAARQLQVMKQGKVGKTGACKAKPKTAAVGKATAKAAAGKAKAKAAVGKAIVHRASTIMKQDKLGCSKCNHTSCKRCIALHELWKTQYGNA